MLLCRGNEDDKIKAVFSFLGDDDGFVSLDELFKFGKAAFKVILTPKLREVMRNSGAGRVENPEQLASFFALECFKAADLNEKGKISFMEFENWFYPKDLKNGSDPSASSFLIALMRKLLL